MSPTRHELDAIRAMLREQRRTIIKALPALTSRPDLQQELRRQLDKTQDFIGALP